MSFSAIRNRLKNPLVTIAEEEADLANTEVDSDVVCAYHSGTPDNIRRFNCTTRIYGRYVKVTMLDHTNFLQLSVIMIFYSVFNITLPQEFLFVVAVNYIYNGYNIM